MSNGSSSTGRDRNGNGHRDDSWVEPPATPRSVTSTTTSVSTTASLEDDETLMRTSGPNTAQRGWNAGAIPMERSAKFGESVKRLFEVLGRERIRLVLVALCAVGSVTLNVIGPNILGHATDLIIYGHVRRRRHRLR